MEEDLHGPGHRRPRRGLPGGQPVRRARPRPRLRLERDDRDLRQHRHLRRGPLPGRTPLPLQGQCLPMEKLAKHEHMDAERDRPDAAGRGDPDRLPHGARDRLRARHGPTARRSPSSTTRSTYFHEADSALGFSELNEPGFVTGPQSSSWRSQINFLFNWAYVDAEPHRLLPVGRYAAAGARTSPDFPILGTGEVRLEGLQPGHAHRQLPALRQAPARRSTPTILVSWNNKQAPRWSSADDQYAYGSFFRSQLIANRVKRRYQGRRKMRSPSSSRRWTSRPPRTSAAAAAAADPQGDRQPEAPALQEALAS